MRRPTTALPATYVHDGRYVLEGDIEPYIAQIRSGPPTYYHCTAYATPLPNVSGAVIPTAEDHNRLLPPEAIARRLDAAQRWTAALHAAGVRYVIPYTCNQALAGNYERHTGMWTFWDHWGDYARFDIGPRPEADPIDWLQRERDSGPHYTYEMRHSAATWCEQYRYAPCANNPYHNGFQRANVRMIAMSGYDGVFMDNNNLNCYCRWCAGGFRTWMAARYTPNELRTLFGWASPDQIELGWRGSRFEWLKTDPLFREFVGFSLKPDELIPWFGTHDIDRVRLADAGNGWLWGRGNEYLSWVYNRLSPAERRRRWGSERLEGWWGIRDERDRFLWAETKRFWAESICANLRKVRRWGSEVLERDFIVVPNWGNLQQYEDIAFREPIGHDVRSWVPGCDVIFWEDDGDPGRVAPAIYLDFAFEYKLALAHGARSACMAALSGDRATCELAHAEAAATCSAFIQRMPEFPDQRAAFTRLAEEHSDWYEGLASAARVGLAFSIENLHLEDVPHVHAVYRFNHYLTDQQVPFDLLVEEHLADADYLAGYRVVIIPAARYMADEACRALAAFVEGGGTLVLAGECGTHDLRAQKRAEDPFAHVAEGRGRLIRAECVEEILPPGGMTREDMIEIAIDVYRTIKRHGSRHVLYMSEDYAVKAERFVEAGPLGALVPGWERLRVADPYAACGLRAFPYVRLDETTGALVAHLVNYNMDLARPAGSRTIEPLHDMPLRLPLPDGWRATGAEWLTTGASPAPLDVRMEEGAAIVRLPEIETYAVVRVALARIAPERP